MAALEDYLKDKRPLLDGFFEAIQDGVIVLDNSFTIVRVNRWMEEKYAQKMPLAGKKCHDVLWDRNIPCSDCPQIASVNKGKPQIDIVPYPSGQSPMEWFKISMSCIEDAGGNIIGRIGHVKDITKGKRAEALLSDEMTQRQLLIAQSRDGIVTLDQNGKVYEANQQFARMLGCSLDEAHQLYVWDWDANFTKAQLLEMIKTIDDTGDHFETRFRRRDGTFCDVELSNNGTIYREQKLIFCICRDISERKRAEKEKNDLITELNHTLAEVKMLQGIIPICSSCKKVRDSEGYWHQVEAYISTHSSAEFTHSMCDECIKKFYPMQYESILKKRMSPPEHH